MKNSIITGILLLSTTIYSQEIKERKWILKINTIALVDVTSFPTFQISAERKINNFISVNAEVGYQLYDRNLIFGNSLDTIIFKEKGFKANIEGRVYMQKLFNRTNGNHNGLFCGLQIFHRQNQETNSIKYSKLEEAGIFIENGYTDYFGIKKNVYGANLTAGFQLSKNRIVFEPSLALGYMHRRIRNYDIQYNESTDSNSSTHYFYPNLESDSGNFFNFSLAVRFGYQF